MAIKNIDDIKSDHIDVLTELGNIGSGHAVSSLSVMLGKPITVNVPKVRIMSFDETIRYLGGPEKIVAGILIRFSQDINGMILYVFDENFSSSMLKYFFAKNSASFLDFDDMDKSALCEIGNIMASSYLHALSDISGLSIQLSVPSICIDMAGAIMSVPAIEFAKIGDKVMFIDDSFSIGNESQPVNSNMILVPELNSINILLKKLGVAL